MRLITCEYRHEIVVGVVTNNFVIPLRAAGPRSMLELIDGGPAMLAQVAARVASPSEKWRLADVTVLAPIPRPRKNIICLGWNYADHAQESAQARARETKLPEHPVVFTKNVTSVAGPYGDIPFDARVTTQLDWEVELGVIVGTGGRGIAAEDALRHVFGYTVINDISARDIQFRHQQYFLGKSLDGSCPMGPVIVTADEIPDPQNLNLHTWVNGELKQSSNTRHMIFQIARTIAILSHGMQLEAGDIISTGTPSGVGFARTPPEFLRAGDIVECEVELIGRLRNRVGAG